MKNPRIINYAWKKKRDYVFQALNEFLDVINPKDCVFLLDVGCANGHLTKVYFEILKSKFPKVKAIGLDISLQNVETNEVIFVKGDARNLPFKDKSIDIVISTEVIEHFVEGERFIEECFRVLKNEGIFILTTPNRLRFTAWPRNVKFRVKFRIKGSRIVPGPTSEHLREYTPQELSNILKATGFKILKLDFIGFNPYLPYMSEKLYIFLDRLTDRSKLLKMLTKWDMILIAKKE